MCRNFRWCFIGAGGIAKITAKELIAEGGMISSVWNRTHKRAERFAKRFNCTAYKNIDDALNKEKVDAAYVNVIHPKHYDLALKCIEKGIPVLCEKALTMNANQARKLFEAAKEKNVYLAEAMWTWYSPVAKRVKEWIENKEIGEIVCAKGSFSFPVLPFNRNPRLTKNELGGGAILDLGVYPIRYAYELFGYPKGIRCKSRIKNEVDLDDEIKFEYQGFDVELFCSFTRLKGDYFVIKGTKGKIKVPFFQASHKAKLIGKRKETFSYKGKLYSNQFKEVEKEILSGGIEPKSVSKKGSIDVMEIMDECRRQNGVVYKDDMF